MSIPSQASGVNVAALPASPVFSSQEGQWTPVAQLREGQLIAVVGPDGHLVWEPTMTLERLPPEPVYDIEVEGTHNFLANGILAHNTALGTEPAAPAPPDADASQGGAGQKTTDRVEDAMRSLGQTRDDE